MTMSMVAAAGVEVDESIAEQTMQRVLDSYVMRGIVENRVRELHLDQMSVNEEQALL